MTRRYPILAVALVLMWFAVPGIAFADSTAYALVSNTTGDDVFGTLNLSTGVFTSIGDTGQKDLVGLGFSGGNLYAAGGNTLYQVNISNGSLATIGSSSPFFYFLFGATGGTLFGLEDEELDSINPSTAKATFIGNTGLVTNTSAMSSGGSKLYVIYLFTNFLGESLFSVDTSTAAVNLIGSTSEQVLGQAMVFDNGVLYEVGSNGGPEALWTISPTDATETFVANTNNDVVGLAPGPTVSSPEPSSLIFLACGLVAAFAATRRKLQLL